MIVGGGSKKQNMKTLKKFVALMTLAALVAGPAQALAAISTTLTKDGGSGAAPIVLAKWEMYPSATQGDNGRDDRDAYLTQFESTGIYGDNVEYEVCSIVWDQDGVGDLATVGAKVFYPTTASGASVHPEWGCGLPVSNQFVLTQLTKAEGIDLVCNQIKTNDNNLVKFNPTAGFAGTEAGLSADWSRMCAGDYELMKGTAFVYCADTELSYEAPSGDYRVLAFAQDRSGVNGTLENTLQYVPTDALEADFNKIDYGQVKLQIEKPINGDLDWDALGTNQATVRNTGNTRIQVGVTQDDMGFGQFITNEYKVRFDGHVGNDQTSINFEPYVLTTLPGELDLSEMDEIDFSIYVREFPVDHSDTYTGTMTLQPVRIDHNQCPPTQA